LAVITLSRSLRCLDCDTGFELVPRPEAFATCPHCGSESLMPIDRPTRACPLCGKAVEPWLAFEVDASDGPRDARPDLCRRCAADAAGEFA
jgi:hypothetical protein